jgi:hypothetical protein
MQFHITLHADASTEIFARWQNNPATAICDTLLYGCINGSVVERDTIAFSAKILHVIICRCKKAKRHKAV